MLKILAAKQRNRWLVDLHLFNRILKLMRNILCIKTLGGLGATAGGGFFSIGFAGTVAGGGIGAGVGF